MTDEDGNAKKTECLDANYPDAKIKNSNMRAKVASKDVYTEPLETVQNNISIRDRVLMGMFNKNQVQSKKCMNNSGLNGQWPVVGLPFVPGSLVPLYVGGGKGNKQFHKLVGS